MYINSQNILYLFLASTDTISFSSEELSHYNHGNSAGIWL